MRTIVVDDEPIMLRHFARLSAGIRDLYIVEQFRSGKEALTYASENPVELAFLDVKMPELDGIELAKRLRAIRPDVLIVFLTAYDEYLRDFNEIGGDYYVVKPYDRETLEMTMDRLRLLAHRQRKRLYVRTFGRFVVFDNGKVVRLTGRAKEILALLVTKRGREMSNEEIYYVIWEGREYSNANMSVFHNALHRLRVALKAASLDGLLISTARGQMLDTSMFDCDYYAWLDNNAEQRDRFDGEFMSEYSWGESLLADILNKERFPE